MKRRKGFTIIELLVVVGIIMVLASILLPTLGYARRKARITQCMNNLKQIHDALLLYQQDHIGQGGFDYFPYRLTYLNRDGYTTGGAKLFICPLDDNKGAQGGRDSASGRQYGELDEGSGVGELPLSYIYEFSGVKCTDDAGKGDGAMSYFLSKICWPDYVTNPATFPDKDGNGYVSWAEWKQCQLKFGDIRGVNAPPRAKANWTGYPPSKFPVLRCFWHMRNQDANEEEVMNMAYTGNIFKSTPAWEDSVDK
jgi:prepilin-type N-terminal cleavage/methylation domain-containing protein